MDRFPTLRLFIKYGPSGAYVVGLFVVAITLWLAWPSLGWPAAVIAVFLAAAVFVLIKILVDLVVLITEMLLPQ